MTSRLYHLMQTLTPKALTTSTAPNSCAYLCFWRKRFLLSNSEEEEEEFFASIVRAFEEAFQESGFRPIRSPDAVEARDSFLRERYRHLSGRSNLLQSEQPQEGGTSILSWNQELPAHMSLVQ